MYTFSMILSKKPVCFDSELAMDFTLVDIYSPVSLVKNPDALRVSQSSSCREIAFWNVDSDLIFEGFWGNCSKDLYKNFFAETKIFTERGEFYINPDKLRSFVNIFFPFETVEVEIEELYDDFINLIITVRNDFSVTYRTSPSLPTRTKVFFNVLTGLLRYDEFCGYVNTRFYLEMEPERESIYTVIKDLSILVEEILEKYDDDYFEDIFDEEMSADFESVVLLLYMIGLLKNVSSKRLYYGEASGPITTLAKTSFTNFSIIMDTVLANMGTENIKKFTLLGVKNKSYGYADLRNHFLRYYAELSNIDVFGILSKEIL